ncbi:hypothetical protein BH10PLA2_BH10PLA2_07470 [soil metagenome]
MGTGFVKGLGANSLRSTIGNMDANEQTAEELFTTTDWNAQLASADMHVRRAAIVALQHFGARATPFAESLIARLDDSERSIREQAAGALVEIGGVASSAAGHLLHALADESPRVRVAVARLLWKVSGKPVLILSTFIDCLTNEESFVRWNAAVGLADREAAAAPATDALAHALHDRDDGVQMHAARALGNVRAAPERIVPALLSLLREHSARRVQAHSDRLNLVVHAAIHNFGAVAVPYLVKALSEPGDKFRLRVLSVLGHLGPQSLPAIPVLSKLLQNENVALRRRSAFVLGQIGPTAAGAAPLLQSALRDADTGVRVASVQALWKLGAWSKDAFQVLLKALIETDTPAAVRVVAIQTLGQIGPDAAEAEPALRRMLAHSATSESDRVFSALALWHIRGDMSNFQSCVDSAVAEGDAQRQMQVLRLLPSLGPEAARFLDVVERLASAADPAVRATAEAVAKRIRGG